MKEIDLYTDGACSGNPGEGGWCAILIYRGKEKILSGYDADTTNNRMELFSVIMGLGALKEKCRVTVYSDSAYTVNAINNGWLKSWSASGWKNAQKQPVKNQDLWNDLILKMQGHDVRFVKVKGHSDNEYNNKCDEVARGEIERARAVAAPAGIRKEKVI